MTQFHRWIPAAYINSIAYLRHPGARSGAVMPWVLALVALAMLSAVLFTRLAGQPSSSTTAVAAPGGVVQAASVQGDAQAVLEDRVERLAKAVDRLSSKFDESSQSTVAANSLRRELAALSKQTETLKRELASVSDHAMQVDTSISNIDVSVSTPEVLSNKLERQKKGLNKP